MHDVDLEPPVRSRASSASTKRAANSSSAPIEDPRLSVGFHSVHTAHHAHLARDTTRPAGARAAARAAALAAVVRVKKVQTPAHFTGCVACSSSPAIAEVAGGGPPRAARIRELRVVLSWMWLRVAHHSTHATQRGSSTAPSIPGSAQATEPVRRGAARALCHTALHVRGGTRGGAGPNRSARAQKLGVATKAQPQLWSSLRSACSAEIR